MVALGASNPEVKQLRKLLRDRTTRDTANVVVIDGPRAVDGAFDRNATVLRVYLGADANEAAVAVARRCEASGVPLEHLEAGVADRISDVRSSPGVFAIVEQPAHTLDALDHGDFWLVLPAINDPGNLGTMIRSAEAAGVYGISIGSGSVDPYNPKVVRASAGALFGVTLLESDAMTVLERLGARGVRRVGAVAHGGTSLASAVVVPPVALVLGHETRALNALPEHLPASASSDPAKVFDELVRIPMAGAAESLNVAMAATVLMFEVARQRDQAVFRDGVKS